MRAGGWAYAKGKVMASAAPGAAEDAKDMSMRAGSYIYSKGKAVASSTAAAAPGVYLKLSLQ